MKVVFSSSVIIKSVFLSLLVIGLNACSDDSESNIPPTETPPTTPESPTTPPTTPTPPSASQLSGSVTAPNGSISNLHHPTFFKLLFPPVYAAVTGLTPVTDATVALIRVDNTGSQVGDVLATTQTSSSGEYSILLPTGVSYSGDLVVRALGNTESMSAIALNESASINPSHQYVYRNLIDSELNIADLNAAQVTRLTEAITAQDLASGIDLPATLSAIDKVAGYIAKQEITVLTTEPGDAAPFAGKWHNAHLEVSLHDSDLADTSGAFSTSIELNQYSVTAPSANTVLATLDSATYRKGTHNYTQTASTVNVHTSGSTVPNTFSLDVKSNGALVRRTSFYDAFAENGANGPLYGWRYQPSTSVLAPAGNVDVKIGINHYYANRYGTIDTSSNGHFDSLDLTNKQGDDAKFTLDLFIKESAGLTSSILNGNHGFINLEKTLDSNDSSTKITAKMNEILFSSPGNYVKSNIKNTEIHRTPSTFSYSTPSTSSLLSGAFSVESQGTVTLIENGKQSNGFVTSAGNLFVMQSTSSSATQYTQDMGFGIKLGNTSASFSAGDKFRFYALAVNYANQTQAELLTLGTPGTLTFTSPTQATFVGQIYGVDKASDLVQIASSNEKIKSIQMQITDPGVSRISANADDGTASLLFDGFVSDDSSRMILVFEDRKNTGTVNEASGLGFILAVKVN